MSDDDSREIFDEAGRVNLPAPSDEALQAAAEAVLGPGVDESLFDDGVRIFRGSSAPGAIFIKGPEDAAGELLSAAREELQTRLMEEARKVQKFQQEVRQADYLDPSKNPLIKFPE